MLSLDPVRLGLSAGTICGLGMFLMTLFSMATGYAEDYLGLLKSALPGFEITVSGSMLGLLYGFMQGFTSFFLIGWLYNLLGPRRD